MVDLLVEDGPDLAHVADGPRLDPLAHPEGGLVAGPRPRAPVLGRQGARGQGGVHLLEQQLVAVPALLLLVPLMLLLLVL